MPWFESLRRWCCGRLGCAKEPKTDRLLDHFMLQMQDEFLFAQHPSGEDPVDNPEIVKRIRQLIEEAPKPLTWEHVYQIERLLVYVRPRSKLEIETDRRLADAERSNLPTAPKYRAQLGQLNTSVVAAIERAQKANADAATATPADQQRLQATAQGAEREAEAARKRADTQLRAILATVLDDMQWFYQKRILKRKALWGSAWRLVAFGVATLLIVGLPFLAFLFHKSTGMVTFRNFMLEWPNYGLFTAMSFGLLGAFFSRLISLQFESEMTVEDAENRFGWGSLIIRGAVGMLGALIVYFLLGTELLGVTLKPTYDDKLAFQNVKVVTLLSATPVEVLLPSPSWCLLLIWSFLAGFSERLVPDSLARAEGQVSGTQKQP
jgi:hypothetical protein